MGTRRTSKTAKTPPVIAVSDWESALNSISVTGDTWKISIGVVVETGPQECLLVKWLLAEVQSGSRMHFKAISRDAILSMVEQTGTQGKLKNSITLPDQMSSLNDIWENAKSVMQEQKQLPDDMMAKLIKVLIYKHRVESERKSSSKDLEVISKLTVKGKDDKKAKPSKEPKVSPSLTSAIEPKLKLQLKLKGLKPPTAEINEPNYGINNYLLLFGFRGSNVLKELQKLGIEIDTIIRLQINFDDEENRLISTQQNYEVGMETHYCPGLEENMAIWTRELNEFWKDVEAILKTSDDKCKNWIVQHLQVFNNTIPAISCLDEIQDMFCEKLYTDLADLMYNVEQLKWQHATYLEHLHLTHVPTFNKKLQESPKGSEYYTKKMDQIPPECVTVPIILHYMLDQVCINAGDSIYEEPVETEEEKNEREIEIIFEDVVQKLSLKTSYEGDKQNMKFISHGDSLEFITISCPPNMCDELKNIHRDMLFSHPVLRSLRSFPVISERSQKRFSAYFHHFTSLFQTRELTLAEIERVLKWITFVNMTLQSVSDDGTVIKCCKTFSIWSDLFKVESNTLLSQSYTKEPISKNTFSTDGSVTICSKPSNDSIHITCSSPFTQERSGRCFQTCQQICSRSQDKIVCECALVSPLPINCECTSSYKGTSDRLFGSPKNKLRLGDELQKLEQLDTHLYSEIFDSDSLYQVLYDAMDTYHFIDKLYYEPDNCYLVIFHNPYNKQCFNHTKWKTRVNSNIALRNFQLHILGSIAEWIEKMDLRVPLMTNPLITPSEKMDFTDSQSVQLNATASQDEWIPEIVQKSLKFNNDTFEMSEMLKDVPNVVSVKQRYSMRSLKSVKTEKRSSLDESAQHEPQFKYFGYDLGNTMLDVDGSTAHLFLAHSGMICIEKYHYLYGKPKVKITLTHNDVQVFVYPHISSLLSVKPSPKMNAVFANGIRFTPVIINMEESHCSADSMLSDVYSAFSKDKIQLLELTVTFPSGLVVQIMRDRQNLTQYLVRQTYIGAPVDSNNDEISRVITYDGHVLKTMNENISEILNTNGNWFQTTWKTSRISLDETLQESNQESPDKQSSSNDGSSGKQTTNGSPDTVTVSEFINDSETSSKKATGPLWLVVTPDGKKMWFQNGQKATSKHQLLSYTAVEPSTQEEYTLRDDGMEYIYHKGRYRCAHFPDGTRITSIYKNDVVKKVTVEHPKFVTVTSNPPLGTMQLQLTQGLVIMLNSSGSMNVRQNGTDMTFNTNGTALFTPQIRQNDCNQSTLSSYVISPEKHICIEAFDCKQGMVTVQADGKYIIKKNVMLETMPNHRRYFVIRKDGSGAELISEQEIEVITEAMLADSLTEMHVNSLPNDCFTESVLIYKPLPKSPKEVWLWPYEKDSIVPAGLSCKDLHSSTTAVNHSDSVRPKFAFNVGNGLNIYPINSKRKKLGMIYKPPQNWEVHRYLRYRTIPPYLKGVFRNTIDEFVHIQKWLQQQHDSAQVVEYRDFNEQKLAQSLLELAKATGLSKRQPIYIDEEKGITLAKAADSIVVSKKKFNHNKYLAKLHSELKEEKRNQQIYSGKQFGSYFRSRLYTLNQHAVPVKTYRIPTKPSTEEVLKLLEKSPPLLSQRKKLKFLLPSAGHEIDFSASAFKIRSRTGLHPMPPQVFPKTVLPSLTLKQPVWAQNYAKLMQPNLKRAHFILKPKKLTFKDLVEGQIYYHKVYLQNAGVESSRFKVTQPPERTGIRVDYSSIPVPSGMVATITVQVHALIPLSALETNVKAIHHDIEIITEVETLYLPIIVTFV